MRWSWVLVFFAITSLSFAYKDESTDNSEQAHNIKARDKLAVVASEAETFLPDVIEKKERMLSEYERALIIVDQ